MKLRHFLVLFGVIGLFILSVHWITLNHDILTLKFKFFEGWPVPVWLALFIFFLAGLFLMGILFLVDAWRKNLRLRNLSRLKTERAASSEALEMAVFFLLQDDEEAAARLLDLHRAGGAADPEARLLEVCMALRSKDYARADALLAKAAGETDSHLVPLLRSRLLHLRGDFDGAIGVLEGLGRELPPSLERTVQRKLRRVYMDAGKWALALALQESILAHTLRPEEKAAEERLKVVLQYEQAKQMVAEGKDKDAASLLRLLVRDHPDFISAWVVLGEILQRGGEDDKAVGAWQEGFLASRSGVLLHKIEDLYLGKEQPEAALEAINQMRFKVQKDILPRFFLGRLYYRLEMMEEAYRFLGNLRSAAPHSAVLHYLLGNIEDRMGKGSQASSSFKRALSSLEPIQNEYFCFACSTPHREWSDRCPRCRAWNSVEINFKEEMSEDDLGLKVSPIENPLF